MDESALHGPVPGREYLNDPAELIRTLAAYPGRFKVLHTDGPMSEAVAAVPGAVEALGEILRLKQIGDPPAELRRRRENLLEEAREEQEAHGDPDTVRGLHRRARRLERLARRSEEARVYLEAEGFRVDANGAVTFAPEAGGRPRHLFRRLAVELHATFKRPESNTLPESNYAADRELIARHLAPYCDADPNAIRDAIKDAIRERRQ